MIKRVLIIIALILINLPTLADEQLQRLEKISEQMNQIMFNAMLREVEANGADITRLKTLIPDVRWDQPLREAYACVLKKYEEKIGRESIDRMLDKTEALLPKLSSGGMDTITETEMLLPKGISQEQATQYSNECGVMQIMIENSMSNDFVSEIMKLSKD
jgi:hypothetical protein